MFETLGIVLVSVVFGVVVVWPAMKRAAAVSKASAEHERAARERAARERTAGERAARERAAMPSGTRVPTTRHSPPPADAPESDGTLDIQRIEGRVRDSSMRKVGDIIERHPSEAASVVRRWMNSRE